MGWYAFGRSGHKRRLEAASAADAHVHERRPLMEGFRMFVAHGTWDPMEATKEREPHGREHRERERIQISRRTPEYSAKVGNIKGGWARHGLEWQRGMGQC